MAKAPTPRPLEIPYFSTGFYSYRSQLFAPFRALGVNVVSYHDAVLEGADMELTDLSEWQQRPGFTQYCSEALATGEVVNQFYSARALNGTLLTMFDSNQRLATFTGSYITTLFTKTTTAQGYVNQVGDTTYFYDGVDAVRYDQIYGLGQNGIAAPTNTLTVSATGGWLPNTFYAGASILLDYNGNVEYAANVSSAGTSLLADASSTNHTVDGTYWQNVSSSDQWRSIAGSTTSPLAAFVTTGFGFSVPTNAVVLGVQVFFGNIAESATAATIAGVSLWQAGAQLGTSKNPATPFTTSYQNQTYGISTDTWGAALTPAIVNDPTFGYAVSVAIQGQRVFLDAAYALRVYYFIPSGTGGTAGVSGSQMPTWSALPGSFTSDGTLRWNNLGVIGQWLPGVAYTIPSVILDSNNNLQSVEVLTAVEPYNNSATYTEGDVVTYSGVFWTCQSAAGISGILPNASLYQTVASSSPPGTSYIYNWIETADPQVSGASVPIWNTAKGGTTNDGALVWTNIGAGNILVNAGYSYGVCYRTMDGHLSTMSNATLNTGALLGGSPLAVSDISSFSITSDVVTFYANQTYSPNELIYVQGMLSGTYLNDTVFKVQSAVTAASYSITNVVVSGGVATFTSVNALTSGTQVTISGLTSDTSLNGLTLTVLSAGLTATHFSCDTTAADFASTADNGTAVVVAYFTAAFTHANVASTPDSGTSSPVIAQLSSTGVVDSRLNYSTNITEVSVTGNLVTLSCSNKFFPGNTVFISGLNSAAFLNEETLLIVTATATQITAYFTWPDYVPAGDNGTATFCGIEVYRTADGGGIWYQTGALVNPGASAWTYTDVNPDTLLNEQLVAPIAHLNDPPPGQLGSIASPFAGGSLCTYWQGRQWLAQGQYLYFDAGQDCLNGDPHQSWPPGNRFEYPGTIIGLAALSSGLVVFGADYMGVALGGPQTLTFYPLVIQKNFGISSPNSIYQDGQTLYVLTTQGQMFSIDTSGKTNEGHYVSDFITANFPPATSYVTVHRNGNDAGLFLGDGSGTLLRYGLNIGAWSVPYYPVGGVKAMASVETSVGTYSLCVAPATAAGFIMTRNLGAWADAGGEYTSAYSPNGVGVTIGSVTLSNPGEPMSAVSHIIGYFDAVGTFGTDQPFIYVLPNEINAAKSVTGFIQLPPDQAIPEPPTGAMPSTSLLQLRWPLNMWNSQASQYMHHLQIKVLFNSNDAAHTIKAMAIKYADDGN